MTPAFHIWETTPEAAKAAKGDGSLCVGFPVEVEATSYRRAMERAVEKKLIEGVDGSLIVMTCDPGRPKILGSATVGDCLHVFIMRRPLYTREKPRVG